MIGVYALALIDDLITEDEIVKLYDKKYLEKVLKFKDEYIKSLKA